MTTSVPTPAPARKSPSDHYIRKIVAERAPAIFSRGAVHGIWQRHIKLARKRLPCGTRGKPVIGRAKADKMLDNVGDMLADNPRSMIGNATETAGFFGVTGHPDTLAAALRLMAEVTPIVVRLGRFLWKVDLVALRRMEVDDPRVQAIVDWQPGDASPLDPQLKMPDRQQQAPASVPDEVPVDPGAPQDPEYRERVRVVVPDPQGPEAPAPEVATSPSRPPTASGWMQSVPKHPRQQQAAALVRMPGVDLAGRTLTEAARDLANLRVSTVAGRPAGHREVAAIARGLLGLQRRGLLDEDLRLPPLARHPWLVILGVRERPEATLPTAGQRRYLRRCGIDPGGLSRAEARALQATLVRRADQAMAWPRQIQRLMEAHGWADRVLAACDVGRVDDGLAATLDWVRGLTMDAYLGLMRDQARKARLQ